MLLALAVVLMLALPMLLRGVGWLVRREWERMQEQHTGPVTLEPPIERVAIDLRRLRRQLELRENRPGNLGKGMKMGALRSAYVEVLCTACRQLDVCPPAQHGRLQTPLSEIYRVESELRVRGLDVRTPDLGSQAA